MTIRKFNDKEKYCPICKTWLAHILFDKSIRNPPSFLKQQCKKCSYLKKYHISPEQYQELMARQGYACVFADCPNKPIHIDHDHACCSGERSCGKCVRGILCRSHNTGLGHFQDDPNELRFAANYVERFRNSIMGNLSTND